MTKQAQEFWLSDEGILIRLEDLAHDFVFQTYNGALKGTFKDAGFKEFIWVADYTKGNIPCNYCDGQNDRSYRAGMFLPRMPAHVKCKCFWDARIAL